MNRSTIAAICTPRGFGGVGIIKLSGPQSVRIARALFRKKSDRLDGAATRPEEAAFFKSHRLRYGVIIRPADGHRIDEVLLATMRAPHTYTGEDVVEINAHAGPVVLNQILEAVINQGAQLAEPGEFTRRAFINGRIDLTQAEAVIDLINAKTTASLEMVNAQMAGHMRLEIERISESVKRLITLNEARIDFPEDVNDHSGDDEETMHLQAEVIIPLQNILERFPEAQVYRDGLKLAVVGRPNVGKSSLMNRLVKNDRAIVTDIPGTTRDAVEDLIDIRGVPILIVDTAGLQKTDNPVEIIGIEKTRSNIDAAHLVLFVVEEGVGITAEDQKIYQTIKDKTLLIVINKRDLESTGAPTEIPKSWRVHQNLRVSALHGEGIAKLEDAIYDLAAGDTAPLNGSDFAPNLRQKELLEKGLKASQNAYLGLQKHTPAELIALDMAECLAGLDEILGRYLKEDILGRIFGQFCIGK